MPPEIHQRLLQDLQTGLQAAGPVQQRMYRALRLAAKYRSQLIAEQLIAWGGTRVRSGPFVGLDLAGPIAEGCITPKLLGCYEAELHPYIAEIAVRGYRRVIDIGCAEGYYAVGLALALPNAAIFAHDTAPHAQEACRLLAAGNGVAARVQVGGLFAPEAFARFAGEKTLVVCDIEGAELELLDPSRAAALAEFDLLVELHEVFAPGLTQQLLTRFVPTHDITVVPFHGCRDYTRFPELERLEHLDRLLATWEWRSGPTPWAWLKRKN